MSTSDRTLPTVVVARRPAPGREREFERWLRRLTAAARHAPGHRHADVQPPTAAHPDEWVVVYQFDTSDALQEWLESPERRAIVDAGADLVDGSPREQVVALTVQVEPVTAVSSFRVRPGNEERYAEYHDLLDERLVRFPGFLRSAVFPPVEGVQDDTVVVFSFDSREHLDAWLSSPERREMLAEIEPLLEGDRTVNVVGGFGGWFARPGMVEVKRWKQASVVLLALFPTTLTLTVLRNWLLPDIGLVLGVLIGNVLGVIALSWLLMPWLTRWLDPWLRH